MEEFVLNESVLAKDGPLLYDAKVKNIADDTEGNLKYFVHFQGWHQRHDIWVGSESLFKYSDKNLELKTQFENEFQNKVAKRQMAKRRARSMPMSKGNSKKRKLASTSMSSQKLLPSSVSCSKIEMDERIKPLLNQYGIKPVMISIKKTAIDPLLSDENIDLLNHNAPERCIESPCQEHLNIDEPSDMDSPMSRVTGITPLAEICTSDDIFDSDQVQNTLFTSSDQENPLEHVTESEFKDDKKDRKIPMPSVLETFVKDDYNLLKSRQKMLALPADPSVDKILFNYLNEKSRLRLGEDTSDYEEFVSGVKEYFNVLLDPALIYNFEKKRHMEVRKKYNDMANTKIYGVVHLLRLIDTIGPFIHEAIDDIEIKELVESHFIELLNYIEENATQLVNEDIYINIPNS